GRTSCGAAAQVGSRAPPATRFNGQAHSSTKLILWLGDPTPRIAVEPKGKEADAWESRRGLERILRKSEQPKQTQSPAAHVAAGATAAQGAQDADDSTDAQRAAEK